MPSAVPGPCPAASSGRLPRVRRAARANAVAGKLRTAAPADVPTGWPNWLAPGARMGRKSVPRDSVPGYAPR